MLKHIGLRTLHVLLIDETLLFSVAGSYLAGLVLSDVQSLPCGAATFLVGAACWPLPPLTAGLFHERSRPATLRFDDLLLLTQRMPRGSLSVRGMENKFS